MYNIKWKNVKKMVHMVYIRDRDTDGTVKRLDSIRSEIHYEVKVFLAYATCSLNLGLSHSV